MTAQNSLVMILGIAGATIFYGRFLIQWYATEKAKRSVVPPLFWYFSIIGSLLLLIYAFLIQSPLGALGQNVNIIIYGRNLNYIWKENNQFSPKGRLLLSYSFNSVAFGCIALAILIWSREIDSSKSLAPKDSLTTWTWLAIGIVGQSLFALRFIIQWIETERAKKSVVPHSFWPISIVAAMLQSSCFIQRHEYLFAISMMLTILIYLRNMYLIANERRRLA